MEPIAPIAHPLHAAAQEGAAGALAALLQAGEPLASLFDAQEPGPEGASLLARCLPLSAAPLGEPIIRELLRRGLDPLAQAPLPRLAQGAIPFERSARLSQSPALACPAEIAVLFPHPGALAALAALPAERLRWLASERDALSAAAASDNLAAIELFAGAGAHLNQPDSQGFLPLHRCQSAAAIACLLDLGADLSAICPATGKSGLNHFLTARFGAAGKEIIALVSARAQSAPMSAPAQSFGEGLSPSEAALASAAFDALAAGNAPAARAAVLGLKERCALVAKPSGETLLLAACRAANWAEAARLLSFGCDMCAMDEKGESALLLLSISRHPHWGREDAHRFRESRGAEIAEKWARSRSGGQGGRSIPWERLSPKGHALIEAFHGRVSRLGDFWSQLAPAALDRGWSPWRSGGPGAPLAHGLIASLARSDTPRGFHRDPIDQARESAQVLGFLTLALPMATPAEARAALDDALASDLLIDSLRSDRRQFYGEPIPPRDDLAGALETLASRADMSGWAPSAELALRAPALCARLEALCLLPAAGAGPLAAGRAKRV